MSANTDQLFKNSATAGNRSKVTTYKRAGQQQPTDGFYSIIQEEASSQMEESTQQQQQQLQHSKYDNSQRSQSQLVVSNIAGATTSQYQPLNKIQMQGSTHTTNVKGNHNGFGRTSTLNSIDGMSAIRPLKSTTSAQQLNKQQMPNYKLQDKRIRKGTTQYQGGDGETTLYTDDLGSVVPPAEEDDNTTYYRGGGQSHQGIGGGHATTQEYDFQDQSDSEADDQDDDYYEESEDGRHYDSQSNISNALQEYQDTATAAGNDNHLAHQGGGRGHYVLFMDPESFIYYRKDLLRNDYIVFEPFRDEKLKNDFFQANQIHLYKIRKLLVLPLFSWNFKGEADLYRRRHFPRQFLQNEASDYPCYVFQSELSKAFNHKGDIETVVDLMEYQHLVLQSGGDQQRTSKGQLKFDIRFKESLVTSTKEFIKNIMRKVFSKYRIKIQPKSGNNLILKADGYREYFEGNYQLLQYERVRACLRKNEPMKLILTEIPKNYRDRRFPPIFRNKQDIPTLEQASGNLDRSLMQAEEHKDHHYTQQQTVNNQFNFNQLKGSSPYFWYPPVPNLKQLYERMEKSVKNKSSTGGGGGNSSSLAGSTYNQQQNHQTSNISTDRNFLRRVVYFPPDKDLVSLTDHRHKTGGTTIPRQNQQIVLHSGECNWRFKFKLIGLERLDVIFNEIRWRVATDNKQTEPRNCTLKHSKVSYKKAVRKAAVNEESDTAGRSGRAETLGNVDLPNVSSMAGIRTSSPDKDNSLTTSTLTATKKSKSIFSIFGGASKLSKSSQQLQSRTKQDAAEVTGATKSAAVLHEEESWLVAAAAEVPGILKQTMKIYSQTNLSIGAIQQQILSKEDEKMMKKKKKKKEKHGHGEIIHLKEDEENYIERELNHLHTPFCNFSNHFSTVQHYQNILNVVFGKMTPFKLQLECTLYHGCEVLTQGVLSDEVYFSNNVKFDQWITFGNLRYCQIPMKTRLSFNLNMLSKEGQTLTIACVSMNLFDEKGIFRNGQRELNVWPFYELDERLGCMKEYNGMTVQQVKAKDFHRTIDSLFSKLVVEFESFICPLQYSSRDEKRIDFFKLTTNKEDKQDKANLINVQIRNQDLAQLKKYLNCNPLSKIDDEVKRDLFKCREHYQTHPQGLPIFLRSVQWNRPIQVNEVYKMLSNWAPMKPEEAISLLDAKFPDERVRQYAVQRISQLSDDDLALYMLQFAQALLYEEQHQSPLAEMLIERSLKNPYVVGHAFYWSLKSNLYLKVSYERYYVLLEQFLMLCGKFKDEIWIQQQVNTALRHVSEEVVYNRYKLKIPFGDVKERARLKLREERKNLPILFTMSIDPKIVIKDFLYEKLTVFSSKKVPLCISSANQQPGGENFVVLFKNGDDLRQDILTLQIIYIMDKIWLANNLDLSMTPYKVLGTDCEQGYLEFVANCKTLAMIQYDRSVFHTFSDDTIEKFMETHLKSKYPQDWKARLQKNREVFIRSTAGYCVASYILGLGDRHPDNIMINYEEGNFLHIDFGHFLGNVKKKFGIKRERDPFVFSKEIAYFVNGGPLTRNSQDNKFKMVSELTEEEHRRMSESMYIDNDNYEIGGGGVNTLSLGAVSPGTVDDSEIVDEALKSRSFRDFEDKCCQAYNILRKEGHQLINMFLIMLSAGMPELKRDDDIQFMVNRLDLGCSEQEASNKFKKEIQKAMQTYSRRFDNFIHNIKAKYGK